MFEFLTTGYIPSTVITIIAIMLIIGFWVFVVPMMNENNVLKEQVAQHNKLVMTRLDDIAAMVKEQALLSTRNTSDMVANIDKQRQALRVVSKNVAKLVSKQTG